MLLYLIIQLYQIHLMMSRCERLVRESSVGERVNLLRARPAAAGERSRLHWHCARQRGVVCRTCVCVWGHLARFHFGCGALHRSTAGQPGPSRWRRAGSPPGVRDAPAQRERPAWRYCCRARRAFEPGSRVAVSLRARGTGAWRGSERDEASRGPVRRLGARQRARECDSGRAMRMKAWPRACAGRLFGAGAESPGALPAARAAGRPPNP